MNKNTILLENFITIPVATSDEDKATAQRLLSVVSIDQWNATIKQIKSIPFRAAIESSGIINKVL